MLGFSPVADTAITELSIGVCTGLTSQSIVLTQASVTTIAEANYTLVGQSIALTQKPVVATAAANCTLGSQNLHLTLHSMRMWNKIDPSQNANWTNINTTQNPTWTEIPT